MAQFFATFVTGFSILISYSTVKRTENGIVQVFLSMLIITLIIYYLSFAAFLWFLGDPALILQTGSDAIMLWSAVIAIITFYKGLKD
jgi:Na+-driven multidrug efflux pump